MCLTKVMKRKREQYETGMKKARVTITNVTEDLAGLEKKGVKEERQ